MRLFLFRASVLVFLLFPILLGVVVSDWKKNGASIVFMGLFVFQMLVSVWRLYFFSYLYVALAVVGIHLLMRKKYSAWLSRHEGIMEKVFVVSVLVGVVLLGWMVFNGNSSIVVFNEVDNEWEDVSVRTGELTPVDSLIVIPPYLEGFRMLSERSAVVNFKVSGVWYGREIELEWVERMRRFCDMEDWVGFEGKKKCRVGYNGMESSRLIELSREYGADYIVVERPKELELSLVYENDGFRLYSLA